MEGFFLSQEGAGKGPTGRSEGPKALFPMNFPDWPKDSHQEEKLVGVGSKWNRMA